MTLLLVFAVALILSCLLLVQGSGNDRFNSMFINSTLTPIDIGGLFNAFDIDGKPSAAGSQQLAAFLMAIKEINNKYDGIHDDILPDYYLRIRVSEAHGFLGAVQASSYMDSSDPSPIAILSGLSDDETICSTDMLETVETILVSCTATTSELSKGRDYPYKVRTVASESFVGTVLHSALYVHLGFRRIVIFSTTDYFSTQSLIAFTAEEYGKFEILGEYVLEPGGVEYADEISSAMSTGGLVFVLLTDPATTSVLLVQGRQMGLFGAGKSIFCHDFAIDPETVALINELDPSSNPDLYLKGVMGFKARPLYPVMINPEGQQFLSRWSQQNNTLSPTCSEMVSILTTCLSFID